MIGSRLGTWLQEHEVSQEEFGKRIGASQGAVSRLITGKREPGRAMANAIERETAGAIRAADWDEPAPKSRRLRPSHA
jgi:transcriptional regulator with XRE-family HTH domain